MSDGRPSVAGLVSAVSVAVLIGLQLFFSKRPGSARSACFVANGCIRILC